MAQTFERWLAVPDVVELFSGISVVSQGNGATTLYLHVSGRDLRVTFNQIWALTIHEEFAHPHVDNLPDLPMLMNKGPYPLLTVTDSEWLMSFSETRLAGRKETPIHYQFISMSYIVDVLSYSRPDAEWVLPAILEA